MRQLVPMMHMESAAMHKSTMNGRFTLPEQEDMSEKALLEKAGLLKEETCSDGLQPEE